MSNPNNTGSGSGSGSNNPITDAANRIGAKASTNAIPQENPSILSSVGAIGRQFNPDGAIGQLGEKIGGPLGSKGIIGSQFDAGQDGIAGHVERAVDGPRNPSGSGGQRKK